MSENKEDMKIIFNRLSEKNKDKIILIAKNVEKVEKLKKQLNKEKF